MGARPDDLEAKGAWERLVALTDLHEVRLAFGEDEWRAQGADAAPRWEEIEDELAEISRVGHPYVGLRDGALVGLMAPDGPAQQPPAPEVAAASAAWIYVPDDALSVATVDYQLVRYPPWFVDRLQLVRFTPTGDVTAALDAALAAASELDVPALVAWVSLDAPPALEELLRDRGGVLHETVDVLAADLTTQPEVPVPEGVELRWVESLADLEAFDRVAVEVFGGEPPPADTRPEAALLAAEDLRVGRGGRVLGLLDGRPVGASGVSVVDGVARLWGGSVLEDARGRGVYRAMLAERMRFAAERGASLALVKGRVETSGPILRRAGFTAYGVERGYRVPLH